MAKIKDDQMFIHMYEDGFIIRGKNKRIIARHPKGDTTKFQLTFDVAQENKEESPTCEYKRIKGKIDHTNIGISTETMELIAQAMFIRRDFLIEAERRKNKGKDKTIYVGQGGDA